MKKLFTLLVSALISFSLFAFEGSRLNISAASANLKLKIEVDGLGVRMQGSNIVLEDLAEGNHNIRVYREKRAGNYMTHSGGVYEIIYATTVYIGSACQVDLTINNNGKVILDSYRVDADDNVDIAGKSNYGYNGSDGLAMETAGNTDYTSIMSSREFLQLKQQIKKERFEANRLISVKTILDKNNVSIQQLKDLMLLFSYENNRVDIAKYAYCKIVDKQNFYQLMDVLTFSSKKDELARFIRESF